MFLFTFQKDVFQTYVQPNYFFQKNSNVHAFLYVSAQRLTYPFPKQQILDSSKLKEFLDDNFTFNENSIRFLKQVENIVRKGEIAHYEQFLLFPTVFSKDLYFRHVKTRACLGKG